MWLCHAMVQSTWTFALQQNEVYDSVAHDGHWRFFLHSLKRLSGAGGADFDIAVHSDDLRILACTSLSLGGCISVASAFYVFLRSYLTFLCALQRRLWITMSRWEDSVTDANEFALNRMTFGSIGGELWQYLACCAEMDKTEPKQKQRDMLSCSATRHA